MPTMSEIWHMFTIYDSLKLPHKKEKKKKTQTTNILGYKQIT